MKKCFKCGSVKPLNEFHSHPGMKDGHLNKCKVCARKDVAKRIKKMWKNPAWVALERERCRAKQARYRALGVAAESRYEVQNNWRKRNRLKSSAHNKARRAQKKGLLIAPEKCQGCGQKLPLQKHHHDYTKPLDVHWLCFTCHGKAHRKDNPLKLAA